MKNNTVNKNTQLEPFVYSIIYVLERMIENKGLIDSHSIMVNGEWGCGKTYLVNFLVDYLRRPKINVLSLGAQNQLYGEPLIKAEEKQRDNPYFVIKFDAFEYDWADDPLIAFASIVRDIQDDYSDNTALKEGAEKVVDKALKVAGVYLVHKFGPIADYLQAFLAPTTQKGAATEIEVSKYQHIKREEEHFKTALGALDGKEKIKLIIIDELDRCNPDFVIKCLERLKYLFSIDNVYFIITADKSALKAIINKHYGELFDTEKYLDKFFEYGLSYPKNMGFIRKLMQGSVQYRDHQFLDDYLELVSATARQAGRLNRVFSLIGRKQMNIEIFCLVGFIKVCQPGFFDFLVDIVEKKIFSNSAKIAEYWQEFIEKLAIDSIEWDAHASKSLDDLKKAKGGMLKWQLYSLFVGLFYRFSGSTPGAIENGLLTISPIHPGEDRSLIDILDIKNINDIKSISAIKLFQKVAF